MDAELLQFTTPAARHRPAAGRRAGSGEGNPYRASSGFWLRVRKGSAQAVDANRDEIAVPVSSAVRTATPVPEACHPGAPLTGYPATAFSSTYQWSSPA